MIKFIDYDNKYYLVNAENYKEVFEKFSSFLNEHIYDNIGDFILDCFIPLVNNNKYSPNKIRTILLKLKIIMDNFYNKYPYDKKFEFKDIDKFCNIYTISEIKDKLNRVLINNEISIGDLFLEDIFDLYAIIVDNRVNFISRDDLFEEIDDTIFDMVNYFIQNKITDEEIFNLFKSQFEF